MNTGRGPVTIARVGLSAIARYSSEARHSREGGVAVAVDDDPAIDRAGRMRADGDKLQAEIALARLRKRHVKKALAGRQRRFRDHRARREHGRRGKVAVCRADDVDLEACATREGRADIGDDAELPPPADVP